MPFTFSHPAIVLPLKKISGKMLSLTGLVIGSVAPDFEYFIRMNVHGYYSHTLSGLFWFDLPLGLLLTFIYHNIVRDQLISNLPEILNRKLSAFKYFDWVAYFKKNWIIVLVSILIGAASHLLWDAFTHDDGYFANKIPFLLREVTVAKMNVEICDILQQLSTLVGGLVVVLAIFSLKNQSLDQSDKKYKYWIWVFSITAVAFIISNLTGVQLHYYTSIITLMVIRIISAFLIGLTVTPLLIGRTAVYAT